MPFIRAAVQAVTSSGKMFPVQGASNSNICENPLQNTADMSESADSPFRLILDDEDERRGRQSLSDSLNMSDDNIDQSDETTPINRPKTPIFPNPLLNTKTGSQLFRMGSMASIVSLDSDEEKSCKSDNKSTHDSDVKIFKNVSFVTDYDTKDDLESISQSGKSNARSDQTSEEPQPQSQSQLDIRRLSIDSCIRLDILSSKSRLEVDTSSSSPQHKDTNGFETKDSCAPDHPDQGLGDSSTNTKRVFSSDGASTTGTSSKLDDDTHSFFQRQPTLSEAVSGSDLLGIGSHQQPLKSQSPATVPMRGDKTTKIRFSLPFGKNKKIYAVDMPAQSPDMTSILKKPKGGIWEASVNPAIDIEPYHSNIWLDDEDLRALHHNYTPNSSTTGMKRSRPISMADGSALCQC